MLDRAQIVALLTELGKRLSDEGIRGEMFLVGGAAIAVAYSERRLTNDIDAVFEPKAIIRRSLGPWPANASGTEPTGSAASVPRPRPTGGAASALV